MAEVKRQCKAITKRLVVGETFRCERERGHDGMHYVNATFAGGSSHMECEFSNDDRRWRR